MRWLRLSRSGGENRPVSCLEIGYELPVFRGGGGGGGGREVNRRPFKGRQTTGKYRNASRRRGEYRCRNAATRGAKTTPKEDPNDPQQPPTTPKKNIKKQPGKLTKEAPQRALSKATGLRSTGKYRDASRRRGEYRCRNAARALWAVPPTRGL